MKNFNSDSRNRSLHVSLFVPQSEEERVVLDLARALNEESVAFLKSILDRYGFEVIRQASREYRQAQSGGRRIRYPRRFFNHLIQKQIRGRKKTTYLNLTRFER